MAFSDKVKTDMMVLCARHCCVCHRYRGLKIEVHHIIPKQQGGEDIIDNAIALCMDCHADAGHYFAGHPKGIKLSPEELHKQKIAWIEIVREHKINDSKDCLVELALKQPKAVLVSKMIMEKTEYENRNWLKDVCILLKKDVMELIRERQQDAFMMKIDPQLGKVSNYDEYIDYLNGDHRIIKEDPTADTCQPVIYSMNPRNFADQEIYYLANCQIELVFNNLCNEVLDDYKVYLHFENVECVDSVNKNRKWLDSEKYHYNVKWLRDNTLVYLPDEKVLVQKDQAVLDSVCFRPKPDAKDIYISWELFARGLQAQGELILPIEIQVEEWNITRYVDNPDQEVTKIKFRSKLEFN